MIDLNQNKADWDKNALLPQQVGVAAFADNLIRFLREAQHGSVFLITTHEEVLAKLHPPLRQNLPVHVVSQVLCVGKSI
jgi:hypothetical protein